MLRLKKGSYRFVCDPHSGIMRGSFKVSWAAITEGRAPGLAPSDQRRTLAVLRCLQQHECVLPGRAAKDRGVATVRTRVRRPQDR